MKKTIFAALAATGLVGSAYGQTEITVTGATAFRAAAVEAIRAAFVAEDNSVFEYAFSGSSFVLANQHYFEGKFPGIPGTTIVRTSFAGSLAGIRDVVGNAEINKVDTIVGTGATNAGQSGVAVNGGDLYEPNFAFSDSTPAQSPYDVSSLVTQPVGAIVFIPVAGASANSVTDFDSLTAQQFRTLAINGYAPLSLFTGSNANDSVAVFLTGRNDGSGTRGVYMAEAGLAANQKINQYKLETTVGTTITQIRRWPLNDSTNASTVWNTDTAGNGGYFSGSAILAGLGRTTASTQVLNSAGGNFRAAAQVYLLTVLGLSDSFDATNVANTGKVLAYNGEKVTPVAIGSADPGLTDDPGTPLVNEGNTTGHLTVADKAKIQNGTYTLWSFENFMYDATDTPQEEVDTFYTTIVNQIQLQPSIGTSGLTIAELGGTTRIEAGAVVDPALPF